MARYRPNPRQLKTLNGLFNGRSLRQSRRFAGYRNWEHRSEYGRFFKSASFRKFARNRFSALPLRAQLALDRIDGHTYV